MVGALTVAAIVFACIWQHRAATAARSLGYPAARSPGWGVGCWFVPIVNLWMPYGAVRDCLPPDHPERARVLRWWVAWLCTVYLGLLSTVFALFSTGAALAVSIPAALAALAVVAWSPGIVTAIGRAHHDSVNALDSCVVSADTWVVMHTTCRARFPRNGPFRGGNPAKTG